MEAAEAAAVEGAIVWLAQTIVETIQPGELDAWLQRVGLAGDIGELMCEVERMETVVKGVKGRAVGNNRLARSLARVKELMYEADDVVDALDYCRLHQQVQGVSVMLAPATEPEGMVGDGAEHADASANTGMLAPAIEPEAEGMVGDGTGHVDASGSTAGIPDNNGRKNRSKERDYFHITPAVNGEPAKAKCIDCGTEVLWGHGTSVLRKHRSSAKCKNNKRAAEKAPNCPSASDNVQNGSITSTNGSDARKRMRTEGNVVTTATPWDKAKYSERIHEIALELGSNRGYVIEYLKDSIVGSDQSNTTSDTRRTSGCPPGKVYGRDWEKTYIMHKIKAAKSNNITVLPVVGIVGAGKTTLAKLVYNYVPVKNQFERIWVWVSNVFDEVRVTMEILDVVTLNNHEVSPRDREIYEGVSNYTKLQEVLKKHMACHTKKFMLVLDDVNDCMNDSQWKDLLDALGSSCTKGNVIIVTTRNLSIAQRLGTVEPVKLRALENENFWLLFKACAFGDNKCKEHLDIGRQISAQLKGNPLAAKSAADMLREQPTLHRWKNIMNNGVWESLQLRGGIMSALKISYYQLPYHLQQCLLFCSIFPNGYLFHIDDLVYMWISSRFVKSTKIGHGYLNDLVNSGFLEQVYKTGYVVLCGIVHDFARLISKTEFATIDGLECNEVLPTVRHFSILTDSVYHRDEQGVILRNIEFEEKLQSLVSSVKGLRMLILIGNYDSLFLRSFHTFMCNSANCTHLRYLKLENKGSSEALPISLSKFYHLEVLDVGFHAIHDMSGLISMRHLVLKKGAYGVSSPAWSSCLQTIHIEDCEGWETLPSLEGLSFLTMLKLRNMSKVTELSIPSLEKLVLIDMPKLNRCLTNSVRDLNSSLRLLEIRRCLEMMFFTLFERCDKIEIEQKSWLPNVNELTVHECPHLMVSNPLPPSNLCKLSITDVSTLPRMEGSSNGMFRIGSYDDPCSIDFLDNKILFFHNLRTITQLDISGCDNLLSISLQGFRQLVSLKSLQIFHCAIVFSPDLHSMLAYEDMAAIDLDVLPSLECLSIWNYGITGVWLYVILQHVLALEELHLREVPPRASSQRSQDGTSTRSCLDKLLRVPSNLVPFLKKMSIESCQLKFQGNKEGFSGFTSLEELRIAECPELISSLVHEEETDEQVNGRWLLPCSLGVLDIYDVPLETLKPCFPGDLTRLTVLQVTFIAGLKSLQLHSCTALEKLKIECCESLDALEGLQSLHNLSYLEVYGCPGLPQCLKSLSTLGYELCPRLERLQIDDPSFLTTPFCKHLTSLKRLHLTDEYQLIDVAGLTCEQQAGLQLLTSLQELRFVCHELLALPVGLHSLLSLKRLVIRYCPEISRLPERGLPPSLEELEVYDCSELLTEQCRKLATSKLNVIIDGKYVD